MLVVLGGPTLVKGLKSIPEQRAFLGNVGCNESS